jgi:hypothetical protein
VHGGAPVFQEDFERRPAVALGDGRRVGGGRLAALPARPDDARARLRLERSVEGGEVLRRRRIVRDLKWVARSNPDPDGRFLKTISKISLKFPYFRRCDSTTYACLV